MTLKITSTPLLPKNLFDKSTIIAVEDFLKSPTYPLLYAISSTVIHISTTKKVDRFRQNPRVEVCCQRNLYSFLTQFRAKNYTL